MDVAAELTPSQLFDFLLATAPVRPVMIWGAPGIGKSALVERFAAELGLPCVSLLGSQLAPEDLIGVPQIQNGKSAFCPPAMIARDEPYCLFLDEVNGASQDVQRAFYSLIHERRIGAYRMPEGSIVLAAGNRSNDNAIVRTMSSALINRMLHVQLRPDAGEWLSWAESNGLHSLVLDYIRLRPDHLWAPPPKTQEPFSTPRSWHMLSDALAGHGDAPTLTTITRCAQACLSPSHAQRVVGFAKQRHIKHDVTRLLKGDMRWPDRPDDRDLLFFMAETFRAHLAKELPPAADEMKAAHRETAHQAKALLRQLAEISLEIAQMVVGDPEDGARSLPNWFLVEVVRDLPRLAQARAG